MTCGFSYMLLNKPYLFNSYDKITYHGEKVISLCLPNSVL